MALMDLLTVGRSLSEVRDRPHRFKLLNGALPKLGKSGAAAITRRFVGAASPSGKGEVKPEGAGSGRMKTEIIAKDPKQANSAPMHVFPAGRWTLNPFKTAPAPMPRQTVQGELSLDRVKPVRNDLSDSDLELVAVKKQQSLPESVKIESIEVPVVRVRPVLERIRQLFRRAK